MQYWQYVQLPNSFQLPPRVRLLPAREIDDWLPIPLDGGGSWGHTSREESSHDSTLEFGDVSKEQTIYRSGDSLAQL